MANEPSTMLQFPLWEDICCPLDSICHSDCATQVELRPLATCNDADCATETNNDPDCQACLDEIEKLCSDSICSDACFQLPPGPDSCNLCALADQEHHQGNSPCETSSPPLYSAPTAPSQILSFPSSSTDSKHLPTFQPTSTLFACHWDGCQSTFAQKEDLTRHVTRDHLGCSVWPPSNSQSPSSDPTPHSVSTFSSPAPAAQNASITLPDWAQQLDFLPFSDSTFVSAPSSSWPAFPAQSHQAWDPLPFQTPPVSTTAVSTPDLSLLAPAASTSQSSTTDDEGTPTTQMQLELHQCQWENCEEIFDSSAALMAHVSDHLGSGKAHYECRWRGCDRAAGGKGFTQRQKAIRHLLTHTGDKPFACKFCDKTFSEATALTQVCLSPFLLGHVLYLSNSKHSTRGSTQTRDRINGKFARVRAYSTSRLTWSTAPILAVGRLLL